MSRINSQKLILGLCVLSLWACPPVTPLVAGIDGSLGVTAPAAFYYEQNNVPYEIDVSNLGDTDAPPPIVVTFTLSPGITLASTAPVDWACTGTWPSFQCDYGSDLLAGGSLPTLKLALDVGPIEEVKDSVRICTQLRVKDDVNPNNDQICDEYPAFAPSATYDLKVTETLYNAGIMGPNHVAYTMVVENLGPDTVWDPIGLEVILPAGFNITGYGGYAGMSCSATTPGLFTCAIGPMGTGGPTQTRGFQVSGEMDPSFSGTATSCATVTAPEDIDLGNNESCHSHEWNVPNTFDLAVSGEVVRHPAPGLTGIYKWYIDNIGPEATTQALDMWITAPPTGTTLAYVAGIHGDLSTPTNTGNCTPSGSDLICVKNVLFQPGDQQFSWMTFHEPTGYTGNAPACLSITPPGDTNAANNELCLDLGSPDPTPSVPLLGVELFPLVEYTEGVVGSVDLTLRNTSEGPVGEPVLAFLRLPTGVRYLGYDQDAPVFCEAVDLEQDGTLVTCIHDGALAQGAVLRFPVAFIPQEAGSPQACAEYAPRPATVTDGDLYPIERCVALPVKVAP